MKDWWWNSVIILHFIIYTIYFKHSLNHKLGGNGIWWIRGLKLNQLFILFLAFLTQIGKLRCCFILASTWKVWNICFWFLRHIRNEKSTLAGSFQTTLLDNFYVFTCFDVRQASESLSERSRADISLCMKYFLLWFLCHLHQDVILYNLISCICQTER